MYTNFNSIYYKNLLEREYGWPNLGNVHKHIYELVSTPPPPPPHPPPPPPPPPPTTHAMCVLRMVKGKHGFFLVASEIIQFWPRWTNFGPLILGLTHWGRDKMAAIFQLKFSNGFSSMKMYQFQLTFHWSLFLEAQLTIFQQWLR